MDISISLTPELVNLIKSQVASGRYVSESEVVSEALRALDLNDRRDEAEVNSLRNAWQDGIASGDAGPIDLDELRLAAGQEKP